MTEHDDDRPEINVEAFLGYMEYGRQRLHERVGAVLDEYFLEPQCARTLEEMLSKIGTAITQGSEPMNVEVKITKYEKKD
jgi:hypothetical protein